MDRIAYFKTHARNMFSILESEYGYSFLEEKTFVHAGCDWSVKLLYYNPDKNLRIEIEQAPYYTDYGFTFSILNGNNNENVILYNIGHESQDVNSKFLETAKKTLFANQTAVAIISGKHWEKYQKILIQK
jgi:hypothetical protein